MENSIPWTEKYRPNEIKDLVLDEQICLQINIFLQRRNNTHLIITGPPGIGKTSTVRCIAKKLLDKRMKEGYLELNAGDDRGVKTISTIIPPFCKRIIQQPVNEDSDGNELAASNTPFSKIILMDEADNMTSKSQCDISNMMKEYGRNTSFIFTCNDSTKIIEDIQSVCRIIRFKPQTEEQINNNLAKICKEENIPFQNSGIATICYISNGDMRKAINDLQKTAYTYKKITKTSVLSICKVPDPQDIQKIIDMCKNNKLVEADNELDNIIKQGYYYLDIIYGFIYVISKYKIEEEKKLNLISIVTQTQVIVGKGLRSKLQLSGMLCHLIKQFQN